MEKKVRSENGMMEILVMLMDAAIKYDAAKILYKSL